MPLPALVAKMEWLVGSVVEGLFVQDLRLECLSLCAVGG